MNYFDSFDCQIQCEELPGFFEYEAMQELFGTAEYAPETSKTAA